MRRRWTEIDEEPAKMVKKEARETEMRSKWGEDRARMKADGRKMGQDDAMMRPKWWPGWFLQ